jgi:hypothetical protein
MHGRASSMTKVLNQDPLAYGLRTLLRDGGMGAFEVAVGMDGWFGRHGGRRLLE